MRRTSLCAGLLLSLALALSVRAEEATGIVKNTSWGAFTLEEGEVLRKFNLSSKTSRYEPETWRPTTGDKVTVTFAPQETRGKMVLAVDHVKLVKAGPDTLVGVESPVSVVITEFGRTGIRARIPSGQIVRFRSGKNTQWNPVGWAPVPGDKAVVEFTVDKAKVGFNVSYTAVTIQKAE